MADQAFDRTPIGYREKPISQDFNQQQSQADRTIRDVLMALIAGRASESSEAIAPHDVCFATGFSVVPASPVAMSVQVSAGMAWQYLTSGTATDIGSTDLMGVDDLAAYRPLILGTPQTFAVPAAPGGPNSRIDIIEVRANRDLVNSETRRQLDAATGAFNPHNFYKTLTHVLDGLTGTVSAPSSSTEPLSYVTGVAGASPTAPTTTAGYIKIAEILVGTGVTSIGAGDIIDRRKFAGTEGLVRGAFRVRINSLVSPGAAPPVLTVRSACFPPGVKFACATNTHAANQRATASFYIVAGEPTEVAFNINPSSLAALPSVSDAMTAIIHPQIDGTDYIVTADSTLKAALAAATPPITVAIGQKVIGITYETRYHDDTGLGNTDINVTASEIEDIEVHGSITLAYH